MAIESGVTVAVATRMYPTSVERIADQSNMATGIICGDSDTNNLYARTETGWMAISVGGAALVKSYAPAISSYTSEQTANGSAGAILYLTMATGAKQLSLTNEDLTAGDNLLFAFGADDTEASANFSAGADVVLAGDKRVVGIPSAAQDGGKLAFRSASVNTVAFRVSQEA